MAKVANFVNAETITHTRLNQIIADIYVRQDHTDFGGFNIANAARITLSGGGYLQSGSNRIGVNVATPLSMLAVAGVDNNLVSAVTSGIGGHVQLCSGAGANTDNKLMVGVVSGTDHTDSYAWLQGIKPGNAVRKLLINPIAGPLPGYGSVGIHTTTPYSALSFGQLLHEVSSTVAPRIALYEEPDGEYFKGVGVCEVSTGVFALGIFGRDNTGVATDLEADLYINSSGNLGVGRYIIGDKLDVQGGVTVRDISGGPAGPCGFFDHTPASGVTRIVSRGVDAATNGAFQIVSTRSDASNPFGLLTILNNGRITASIPNSNPGAGGGFWYDPADSNRVKYAA